MTKTAIMREETVLAVRLIPSVKSLKLVSDKFFRLADRCQFEIEVPAECAEKAVGLVAGNIRAFWKVEAKVSASSRARLPRVEDPEGYAIRISSSKVAVAASSLAGVRYATHTLRQLAESERGVMTSTSFFLPCVAIEDSPSSRFRGVHLCLFPRPETEAFEIERSIRLAAYYKFNHVVLESWGAMRLESRPEFGWADGGIRPYERGEIRRFVRLGRELGVTLIPQVNIFGHASAARDCTGKHALLDFHPEYAPLFEPEGWCWCLSNPETRRFLTDVVEELDDLFERPPYFHLGCDEAVGAASCALCRRADYPALLLDHLKYFNGLLKARGARPMVWHDMFLDKGDKRWAGYTACGRKEFAGLLEKLPRDFVICDWQYGYPSENGEEPDWPTVRHFAGKGFDVLVCPWYNTAGTFSLGRLAAENGGPGVLMTTWHRASGIQCFNEFCIGACAAWNPAAPCLENGSDVDRPALFNTHVREVNRDMGCGTYEELGTARRQTHPFFGI